VTTQAQRTEFATRRATLERLLKSAREELAHMLSCTDVQANKDTIRNAIGTLRNVCSWIEEIKP